MFIMHAAPFLILLTLLCSFLGAHGFPLERRVKLPKAPTSNSAPPATKPGTPTVASAAPAQVAPAQAQPVSAVPAATKPAQSSSASQAVDPSICTKQTSCSKCVTKNFRKVPVCGFTTDNRCVLRSENTGSLSLTVQECDARNAADLQKREARAQEIFAPMKRHVFQGTPNDPLSGRHLTSTFTAANPSSGIVRNAVTSLASFSTDQPTPLKKTMWNDVPKLGGKYTQAIATRMCIDAIVGSMVLNSNSVTTPLRKASIVVKSFPGGPNICVAFWNMIGDKSDTGSCFPLSVNPVPPAQLPLGKRCNTFA